MVTTNTYGFNMINTIETCVSNIILLPINMYSKLNLEDAHDANSFFSFLT